MVFLLNTQFEALKSPFGAELRKTLLPDLISYLSFPNGLWPTVSPLLSLHVVEVKYRESTSGWSNMAPNDFNLVRFPLIKCVMSAWHVGLGAILGAAYTWHTLNKQFMPRVTGARHHLELKFEIMATYANSHLLWPSEEHGVSLMRLRLYSLWVCSFRSSKQY